MLRGIITIFTVFVLLLSAVKASEDYYLGKLGKPVEEVPFDGGKPTGASDTMDYFEKLATA